MKLDMYEVLSRWGVWARESSGVDYPPIAAGFKGCCHRQTQEKSPVMMMMGCLSMDVWRVEEV